MSQQTGQSDQYTQQDPKQEFGQPDTQGKEIPAVGEPGSTTGQMDAQPDHGEENYRGSGRLTGKKALITGGDSGIGRAVAIAFAREGADVAFVYLPNEDEDARETTKWVEEAGRKAVAILADITTEQFDRVLKTNLYGMFWITKAALEHMGEGGSIINTSSIQAYQPSPELLDYAMTKGAIVNFSKGLGQALAERGIRVNTVAPGPIWTPLIPATMPSEKVESFGSDVPLGRAGQPVELAPAFVFFASQESSYITAQVLGVTGGSPLA